ncbi:hypothetical protein PIB30_062630 [Stylosanthes scabra]|uniref:Uncharacterized protein n=1 Tax=Stylosanthes scabra TaxID=79078 RepID=A0ABU6TLV9_9FABA|nr:hypothetical protein [Stylosanthes scabra]
MKAKETKMMVNIFGSSNFGGPTNLEEWSAPPILEKLCITFAILSTTLAAISEPPSAVPPPPAIGVSDLSQFLGKTTASSGGGLATTGKSEGNLRHSFEVLRRHYLCSDFLFLCDLVLHDSTV